MHNTNEQFKLFVGKQDGLALLGPAKSTLHVLHNLLHSFLLCYIKDGWNYFDWIKIEFRLHHKQLN